MSDLSRERIEFNKPDSESDDEAVILGSQGNHEQGTNSKGDAPGHNKKHQTSPSAPDTANNSSEQKTKEKSNPGWLGKMDPKKILLVMGLDVAYITIIVDSADSVYNQRCSPDDCILHETVIALSGFIIVLGIIHFLLRALHKITERSPRSKETDELAGLLLPLKQTDKEMKFGEQSRENVVESLEMKLAQQPVEELASVMIEWDSRKNICTQHCFKLCLKGLLVCVYVLTGASSIAVLIITGMLTKPEQTPTTPS